MSAERGSASVYVVVAMMLVVIVMASGLLAGRAYASKGEARTAADLAALAGADVHSNQHRPAEAACAAAARSAELNRAKLTDCDVTGELVAVRVEVVAPFGTHARAEATAGPVGAR